MMSQYVPKRVGFNGFCDISVNLTQLLEFFGLY
jgi:hypothetical protein